MLMRVRVRLLIIHYRVFLLKDEHNVIINGSLFRGTSLLLWYIAEEMTYILKLVV